MPLAIQSCCITTFDSINPKIASNMIENIKHRLNVDNTKLNLLDANTCNEDTSYVNNNSFNMNGCALRICTLILYTITFFE